MEGLNFKLLRLNEPRVNMTVLCFAFTVIALGLLLQPRRFGDTPSYANLLNIAHAYVWAVAYIVPAMFMATSLWKYTNRTLVIITHTLTIALLSVWEYAFIVRWFTDTGTTIVNPLTWGLMLFLAVRSFLLIEVHITPTKGQHRESD